MNRRLLYFFISVCPLYLNAQTITTIAGVDSAGYNGDGIAAIASELNRPFSIGVNNTGNVYIADRYNSRIRCVAPDGIISTIAGTGVVGFSGDGGPATAAQIATPTGVAADGAGNVYFADKSNNAVRKISVGGIISVYAGNGTAGRSGDGGAATAAELTGPNGVAVDAVGNVYIADQGNSRVRKVSVAGTISTIAGTDSMGYNGDDIPATTAWLQNPYAVAVDRAGNVYIGDVDNERIRKVDLAGMIWTVAGTGTGGNSGVGGPATAAQLNEPIGVGVDSAGNIYISDAWNSRICVVNSMGMLNTICGTGVAGFSDDGGPANEAELNGPYGVAVDRSGVYVADYGNNRIRYITYSTTGIGKVSNPSSLQIYPNPSTGAFTLSLTTNMSEPAEIVMTNVLGQVTYRCEGATNAPLLIAQPEARPGLYFVSVTTSSGKWVGTVSIGGR